jgi:hypothetical protein
MAIRALTPNGNEDRPTMDGSKEHPMITAGLGLDYRERFTDTTAFTLLDADFP